MAALNDLHTSRMLLDEMSFRLQNGIPFGYVKCGDGELFCMQGVVGENCDHHPYSPELAQALRDAFEYLKTDPYVRIVHWHDQECYQSLLHYVTQDREMVMRFWQSVREADAKKIYVGPERMAGAANMLHAIHVRIPLVNAFQSYELIRQDLRYEYVPGAIYVFTAGMSAKVWIADLWRRYKGVTCIDAGSALDPIFVGNTRTGQLEQSEVRRWYASWLNGSL